MKIRGDALATRLAKGLGPLYVLSGDEPLLVEEALEAIRARARENGCDERETHFVERSFDWDAFGAGLQGMSLFSSRRLIELRLPTGKPGEAGARFLAALAARPDTGNVLVLLLPRLDSATARSKWAAALAEAGVWLDLPPPGRAELPGWLRGRLRRLGLGADDEAVELLASLVEGNLLAARQELDKLALLADGTPIGMEAVRESVADGARFDVFQLADAALAGDVGRTVRVARGLQREGEAEVLVLWSLVREILGLAAVFARMREGRDAQSALEAAGIWRSRHDLYRRALRGRSASDVARLVRAAAQADLVLKGARPGVAWNALHEVALELAGARLAHAETA